MDFKANPGAKELQLAQGDSDGGSAGTKQSVKVREKCYYAIMLLSTDCSRFQNYPVQRAVLEGGKNAAKPNNRYKSC